MFSVYLSHGKIACRPVVTADDEFLGELELHPRVVSHWRHGGFTPPPGSFAQSAIQGSAASWIIERSNGAATEDPTGVGLVVLYDYRPDVRSAWIAVLQHPDAPSTAVMRATLTICGFLFGDGGIERLFVEIPEYNAGSLAGLLRKGFLCDIRMAECRFMDGRYWDAEIWSCDRASFLNNFGGLLERGSQREGLGVPA